MRPISDLGDVRPSNVLYHSAFGFARVRDVADGQVVLQWEKPAENLPLKIGTDSLFRVYTRCAPGGFFDRAMNDPDDLRELLQVDPTGGLHLLLQDVQRPQRKGDLRDWIVGRGLMSERTFDRWWERLQPILTEDGRFAWAHEELALHDEPSGADSMDRLDNPLIPAARRLDIAMAHRDALGEDAFRKHALVAWQTGGTRVRDLAMAVLSDVGPNAILPGLLGPSTESVDAVIHALRNAGWSPQDVDPDVRARLIARAVEPQPDGPVDAEGRLAATLWRWGAPGIVAALARAAATARGQSLVDAAFAALPPRREEALAVALLEQALGTEGDTTSAEWLSRRLVEQAEDTPPALVSRLESGHPAVAARLRRTIDAMEADERTGESEEGPHTVEITKEVFREPVSIGELPPRLDRAFLPLGLSLARALARHHAAGRVVTPTRDTVRLHPDGSVEIAPNGDPRQSPRAPGEPPSKTADVYAAGVLLIEALVGRTWPRNLSGDRAIPFLRHVSPDLPPSALAPLAVALDPQVAGRPADAVAWLLKWQAAAVSEEARVSVSHDPKAKLRLGYDTHVGRMKILHTQTNQDALYVSVKGALSLICVCDGISTANTGSGDLAAGITTQVVASLWEQWLPRLSNQKPEDAHEFLDRALRMANQAVCEASLRLAGGRLEGRVPMGTTAVVAVVQGNRVSIAWLGDSRAYVVGAYGAAQLTADANQAGERMVDWHRGLAPIFDATGFALVRYVGHFDELGHAEPLPALHADLVLVPNEKLLLCSDGITDYIADNQAQVSSVLAGEASAGDPDEIARSLVDLANRGGGDNATVVVATLSA